MINLQPTTLHKIFLQASILPEESVNSPQKAARCSMASTFLTVNCNQPASKRYHFSYADILALQRICGLQPRSDPMQIHSTRKLQPQEMIICYYLSVLHNNYKYNSNYGTRSQCQELSPYDEKHDLLSDHP